MGWFSIGKRFLKILPDFLLGTGSEAVGAGMRAAKGSIWTRVKAGGLALEAEVAKKSLSGGFVKRNLISLKSLPKELCAGAKGGVNAARLAGKSLFAGGAKGVLKTLGKRMPFIGALLTVGIELPNIISAFKDGGLKAGLKEIGGAGVELGCMAGGAAIGSAICPGIGTVVGGLIGGIVGFFARGKTHSDKKAEEEAQAQARAEAEAQEREIQAAQQLMAMGYSEAEIQEAIDAGYSPSGMVEALAEIEKQEAARQAELEKQRKAQMEALQKQQAEYQARLEEIGRQQQTQYTDSYMNNPYVDSYYNPYMNPYQSSLTNPMLSTGTTYPFNNTRYGNDVAYQQFFTSPLPMNPGTYGMPAQGYLV